MRDRKKGALLALPAIIFIAAPPAFAQRDIRTERIQFETGATSAVLDGSIAGYDIVDYVLGAGAGQYMSVLMTTDHTATYFNVLPPGEDEVAIFIGSTSGNQFDGILDAAGDYKIRVYMMRSAARRNEAASYRLDLAITDADDATRAGLSDFDATGQLPCSQTLGQPTRSCDFGVARSGGGTATVVVTKPDGMKRAIFFVEGTANSADTSQADGYGELEVTREGDLTIVRVGAERYEIPDAVVYGG